MMIELPENPYEPALNETDEVWANIVNVRTVEMLRRFVELLEGEDKFLERDLSLPLPDAEYVKISMRKLQELKDKLAELEKQNV